MWNNRPQDSFASPTSRRLFFILMSQSFRERKILLRDLLDEPADECQFSKIVRVVDCVRLNMKALHGMDSGSLEEHSSLVKIAS